MITVISLIIELSLDYKDVIIYASIILRIKSECISTTSNNNLKWFSSVNPLVGGKLEKIKRDNMYFWFLFVSGTLLISTMVKIQWS